MQKNKKFIIIIGGNRCGTTSLYHYLSGHPQIIATKEKESRFFLDTDYEIDRRSKYSYDKKMDTYLKFFREKKMNERAYWYLDSSPGFLYSKRTPERIKKFFSNDILVLVALLRDPIDRFISWYNYDRQLGNIPQDMAIEKYYQKNTEPNARKPFNRLRTGCYSHYLKRYKELFSEKLFVYRFEKLKNNPNELVENILNELGLDADYIIKDTSPHNKSKKIRSELLNNLYMGTRKLFQNSISKDSWLHKLLKKGSRTYQKFNYTSIGNDVRLNKNLCNKLKSYYEDEYQKLKRI